LDAQFSHNPVYGIEGRVNSGLVYVTGKEGAPGEALDLAVSDQVHLDYNGGLAPEGRLLNVGKAQSAGFFEELADGLERRIGDDPCGRHAQMSGGGVAENLHSVADELDFGLDALLRDEQIDALEFETGGKFLHGEFDDALFLVLVGNRLALNGGRFPVLGLVSLDGIEHDDTDLAMIDVDTEHRLEAAFDIARHELWRLLRRRDDVDFGYFADFIGRYTAR